MRRLRIYFNSIFKIRAWVLLIWNTLMLCLGGIFFRIGMTKTYISIINIFKINNSLRSSYKVRIDKTIFFLNFRSKFTLILIFIFLTSLDLRHLIYNIRITLNKIFFIYWCKPEWLFLTYLITFLNFFFFRIIYINVSNNWKPLFRLTSPRR